MWQLVPSLDFVGWRSALLEIHSAWSRLMAGPFMGFNQWYFWGLSFWVGSIGAILLWRRLWPDAPIRIALLSAGVILVVLVAYFGLVTSSVGYALNYRYPFTALPFVAIAGGAWLGVLLDPDTIRS
jgi:hypothetical protein